MGLHAIPKEVSIVTTTVYYFCGFAVPFFFMTSGYFLLNRGSVSWNYIWNRIFGIIKLIFLWNAILVTVRLLKQLILDHYVTIGLSAFFIESAKSIVEKGWMWHFWYMGALIIIYTFLPFVSRLSKNKRLVLLGLTGSVAIVFEALSFVQGKPMQAGVIQTFRIWTWLFYFVLGSEMKIVKQFLTRINVRNHVLIAIFLTIVVLAYQDYIGATLITLDKGLRLPAEYFYDSILDMLWISTWFSLLLRVHISVKAQAFIRCVAPLTMGIYIIHPFLLKLVGKIVGRNSVGESIIFWGIVLLISTIIAWIINKIPIRKYLLKI